jgi:hypothetical protein
MEALTLPLLHALIHRSEWKEGIRSSGLRSGQDFPYPRADIALCSGYLSKTPWPPRKTPWPPRPKLTVHFEAFYHLPLRLVLPEISGNLFLIRVVLSDPLR